MAKYFNNKNPLVLEFSGCNRIIELVKESNTEIKDQKSDSSHEGAEWPSPI